jgi:hypothetical protein
MQIDLSRGQVGNLQRALEMDIDRAENHLAWLAVNRDEPEAERQRVDTAAAIALGEAGAARLTMSGGSGHPQRRPRDHQSWGHLLIEYRYQMHL